MKPQALKEWYWINQYENNQPIHLQKKTNCPGMDYVSGENMSRFTSNPAISLKEILKI
jgi:hypothetical protein